MKSNVDIDRISLEDRVNALELRVPGGSAGNWSGSIPFVSADVIDAAPDNAITNTSGGWLMKINIPDSGAVQGSTLRGMSVKLAAFYPVIGGITMTMTQMVSNFSIIQTTNYVGNVAFSFSLQPPSGFLESIGSSASARVFPSFVDFWSGLASLCYYDAAGQVLWHRINFGAAPIQSGAINFGLNMSLSQSIAFYPTVSCSAWLRTPDGLGVGSPFFAYGKNVYLGGVPVSPSGYSRKPSEQPPVQHPTLAFLPQSWR